MALGLVRGLVGGLLIGFLLGTRARQMLKTIKLLPAGLGVDDGSDRAVRHAVHERVGRCDDERCAGDNQQIDRRQVLLRASEEHLGQLPAK